MKRLILFVILILSLTGCLSDDSDDVVSYELSDISQSYARHSPIEGVITNTGNVTLINVSITAIVERDGTKWVCYGVADDDSLSPAEYTEFLISRPLGCASLESSTSVEYRVTWD